MTHHYTLRFLCPLFAMSLLLACGSACAGEGDSAPPPLGNEDIVKLVKGGASSELIVGAIRSSPVRFDLSANGMLNLKSNGVSDEIIQAMLSRQADAMTAHSQDQPAQHDRCNEPLWLQDNEQRIPLQKARVETTAKVRAMGLGGARSYLAYPVDADSVFLTKAGWGQLPSWSAS